MKRFLIAIALLGLLTSCDDGDIIVTDFDFEDSTLQFCDGPDKFVIYATNNDDVNESISLEFNNSNITKDLQNRMHLARDYPCHYRSGRHFL